MLGWEFPPFFAGGVGMVCYELTREMVKRDDVSITYIMPFGPKNIANEHINILVADNIVADNKISVRKVPSLMHAYMGEEDYERETKKFTRNKDGDIELFHDNTLQLYGKDLISEVYNFAEKTKLIAEGEDFDVIHAHDWQTIPAAIEVKKISGKPLVLHVHNTIYDRYLGMGGEKEKEIELEGIRYADKVIAISHFIKNTLIEKYGVNPDKIEVIHNAKIGLGESNDCGVPNIKKKNKIVLYAGRVTMQKGPNYFVEAAAKVLEHCEDVRFVMIGAGDLLNEMIRRTAELGISDKFIFHGFYSREEGARFFEMADVFVMPSVSEPFGVVPLEAMLARTPSIISKQSGCAEVINNALKVDFWDVDQIANNIINVLKYDELSEELTQNGSTEVRKFDWNIPAQKCINVYNNVIG